MVSAVVRLRVMAFLYYYFALQLPLDPVAGGRHWQRGFQKVL
jgi:hypothetical protein